MIVDATAPVRVCDVGGWTDTWFARSGAVFSIAVQPGARARVVTGRASGPPVVLHAPDLGDRYGFDPSDPPGRQPLLEAAVAEGRPADGSRIDLTVRAGVPPGCATGTSAAVVVAVLGALAHLAGERPGPAELARRAHRVETERLGLQSGVQDQLAAAFGGINLFAVRYPEAEARPVAVDDGFRAELGSRLVLVALGRPHRSSAVHEEVIARLERRDGTAELDALRAAAHRAAAACTAGDLAALGQAMTDATEGQRALHPALVSADADALAAAARSAGALGWKVNGAGGDGGSLTFLAGGGAGAAPIVAAVTALPGAHHVVPVHLAAAGLRARTADTG